MAARLVSEPGNLGGCNVGPGSQRTGNLPLRRDGNSFFDFNKHPDEEVCAGVFGYAWVGATAVGNVGQVIVVDGYYVGRPRYCNPPAAEPLLHVRFIVRPHHLVMTALGIKRTSVRLPIVCRDATAFDRCCDKI